MNRWLTMLGLVGLVGEGALMFARHGQAQRDYVAREKAIGELHRAASRGGARARARGPGLERVSPSMTRRQRSDVIVRNVARAMSRVAHPRRDAGELADLIALTTFGRPPTDKELRGVQGYTARAVAALKAPELAKAPGGGAVRVGLVLAMTSPLRRPGELWPAVARAQRFLASPTGRAWARTHRGTEVYGQPVTASGLLGELVQSAAGNPELGQNFPRHVSKAFRAVNPLGRAAA